MATLSLPLSLLALQTFGAIRGTTLSGKDGLLVRQAVQIGCYSLQYVLCDSNQHSKGKTNMSKGK